MRKINISFKFNIFRRLNFFFRAIVINVNITIFIVCKCCLRSISIINMRFIKYFENIVKWNFTIFSKINNFSIDMYDIYLDTTRIEIFQNFECHNFVNLSTYYVISKYILSRNLTIWNILTIKSTKPYQYNHVVLRINFNFLFNVERKNCFSKIIWINRNQFFILSWY